MLAKNALVLAEGRYFFRDDIERLSAKIISVMKSFFFEKPHIDGLTLEYVAKLLEIAPTAIEPVMRMLVDECHLSKKINRYDISGRILSIKGELKDRADAIEEIFRQGSFNPPSIDNVAGTRKISMEALEYLLASGKLVKIGASLVFHQEVWKKIVDRFIYLLSSGEPISVGQFREAINSSRKYVVPILEEMDRLKITKRQGDLRIPGDNYDKAKALF